MYDTQQQAHYNKVMAAIKADNERFAELELNAPSTDTHTLNQIWAWCEANNIGSREQKVLGLFWAFELCEALGESPWCDAVWQFQYRPYMPIKRATTQVGIQKVALEFFWLRSELWKHEHLQFSKVEFLAANDGVNFISAEAVQAILS